MRARLLLVTALAACVLVPAASAANPEQALAAKYAPVVRIVEHNGCLPGKPYLPLDVNLLFDEPTVALRGPWGNDLVKIAPNAQERNLRDSLASRIYSGTSEIQRTLVAHGLGL